jgi:glycosyltransferase involved in cell wall biosynthesis
MVKRDLKRFVNYAKRRGLREAFLRGIYEVRRQGSSSLRSEDSVTNAFIYTQGKILSEWNIPIVSQTKSPKFSILMPAFKSNEKFLTLAVESVLSQSYHHWELIIVDDGSKSKSLVDLLYDFANKDPRIQVDFLEENSGISAATNRALDIATGDYVCLMDHDDLLDKKALELVAATIIAHNCDWVYSDEAKINEDGTRVYDLFFKPDWSPNYLLTCMYTAHFAAYRIDLAKRVRFTTKFDGAQDYDFVLRFRTIWENEGLNIMHIPFILYYWRAVVGSTALSMSEKPKSSLTGLEVLKEAIKSVHGVTSVNTSKFPGSYEVQSQNWDQPISVIIPSALHVRDGKLLLESCLESLFRTGLPKNSEIVVVLSKDANEPILTPTFNSIIFLYDSGYDANVARKMNLGAKNAQYEALVFLNDDISVIYPNTTSALAGYLRNPKIGTVGPALQFANGTLQCGGVALNVDGLPDHILRSYPATAPGYYFSNVGTRDVTANTGAFLAILAKNFRAVEGFNERFAMNYNDIDLCLRLRQIDLGSLFVGHLRVHHLESASREPTVLVQEERLFLDLYGNYGRDGFYPDYMETRPPNYGLNLSDLADKMESNLRRLTASLILEVQKDASIYSIRHVKSSS